MSFERFTYVRRKRQPLLSIYRSGQLGFNQEAIATYHLATFRYAVLYFDTETQRIGIRLTNDGSEPGSRLLRHAATPLQLAALPFLHTYNIRPASVQHYPLCADGEFLVADITHPLEEAQSCQDAAPLTKSGRRKTSGSTAAKLRNVSAS